MRKGSKVVRREQYFITKTEELIIATKDAIDILMTTLKEKFDFTETSDANKLKTFAESKKVSFFAIKELLSEVEKLEQQLKNGDLDMEEKEFSSNLLEEEATGVS